MCNLSDNIYDYYNVSQGKVTIPNMDDGEEFALTDVSVFLWYGAIECIDIIIEIRYDIFFFEFWLFNFLLYTQQ